MGGRRWGGRLLWGVSCDEGGREKGRGGEGREGGGGEGGGSTAAMVAEVGIGGYAGHGVVVGVDHGERLGEVWCESSDGRFIDW